MKRLFLFSFSLLLTSAMWTAPALAQDDLEAQVDVDLEMALSEGEAESALPDVEDVLQEIVDENSETGLDEAAINTLLDAVDLEASQLAVLSDERWNEAFENGRFDKFLVVRDILKQYSSRFTKEQRDQVKLMRKHVNTIQKNHRRAVKMIRKAQMRVQAAGRMVGKEIRNVARELVNLSAEERREAVARLVSVAREQREMVRQQRAEMYQETRDEFRSWCLKNPSECRERLLDRQDMRDRVEQRKQAELLRWCDRVSDADACRARLQERWKPAEETVTEPTDEMSDEEAPLEEMLRGRRR